MLMAAVLAVALVLGAHRERAPTPTERVRHIASGLRCPTCQGQSVLESNAPISQAMRGEIRRRIEAGQTDAEIRQYLASRYGPAIMLDPPKSGPGAIVWFLPLALLGLSGAGLAWAAPRWRARADKEAGYHDVTVAAQALKDTSLGNGTRGGGRSGRSRLAPVAAHATLTGLEEQRTYLLRSIADLEGEWLAGDLDDESYNHLRADSAARATRLLADIKQAKADLQPLPAKRDGRRRMTVAAAGIAAAVGAGALLIAATRSRGATQPSSGGIRTSVSAELADARRLAQEGRVRDAEAEYNRVLAADAENPEALAYRGFLMAVQGAPNEAMASIDHALQVDPAYPDGHLLRGLVLAQKGDATDALAELQTVLARNPPEPIANAAQQAISSIEGRK